MSTFDGRDSLPFEDNPNDPMQPDDMIPQSSSQYLELTYGDTGDGGHETSSSTDEYMNAYELNETKNALNHGDDHMHEVHFRLPAGDESMISGSSIDAASPMLRSSSPGGRNEAFIVDPNTPGRVVETGLEHTGRWTRDEHSSFLAGLKMYGKEWKKVAAKVKTRTVVQTRTHAQKYFQKLQKTVKGRSIDDDFDDMPDIDMGTLTSDTKKPSSVAMGSSVKLPHEPTHMGAKSLSESKKQRKNATSPVTTIQQQQKLLRRTSTATYSAAQVISTLSSSNPSASSLVHNSHMMRSPMNSDTLPSRPRHGFSSDIMGSSTPGMEWHTSNISGGSGIPMMKIRAPDPAATMSIGNFPEPSPAATGKRKLDELAAARMLAGVFGDAQNETFSRPPLRDMLAEVAFDDGPPTPPPSGTSTEISFPSLTMSNAPVLPFMGSVKSNTQKNPYAMKGLSLHIVNPETLGVSFESKRKRSDGDSPVTPWDNQLEALMSEKTLADDGMDSESDDNGNYSPKESNTTNLKLLGNTDNKSQNGVHPVCDPTKSLGRTALHRAVCEMNINALLSEIEKVSTGGQNYEQKTDEAGFCPIHSACALRLQLPSRGFNGDESNVSIPTVEILRILLRSGADPNQTDRNGNSPLHWAARAGDKDSVDLLLGRNIPLDGKNIKGETPLHWALRSGIRAKDVVTLLLTSGTKVTVLDKDFRRPIDVVCEGFLDEEKSVASLKVKDNQYHQQGGKRKMSKELKDALKGACDEKKEMRAHFLIHSTKSRSLVLHHPECLEHQTKSVSDWEAPDRVLTIMKRILPSTDSEGVTETSGIFPHEVSVSKDFDRANLDLLSRVHSTEYLSFVNKLSKDLEKKMKESHANMDPSDAGGSPPPQPVIPFTPMVQRTMIKIAESNVKLGVNSDTSFSAGSLRAARRAAGAVQHAVDCVLVGRSRNAFCVVRPPGHHAGINGLLDGGESCGFCIFNNVAAGALYAIQEDQLVCERCAIVDIDVHHGNGTEEIVRKCHDPSKLFFFSIHLYDNDKKKKNPNQFAYKFYPGTGDTDDLALNIINVPIVPLWKDQSQVAAPKTHNTRNKTRNAPDPAGQDDSDTSNNQRISSRQSEAASDNGSNRVPSSPGGAAAATSGRMAYREAIRNRLLPALRAFNPDLILISAGFDALKGDVGNARHEGVGREKMGIDLEPEDYAWTTRKILEIADICCNGRVVSVLEGGYGRTPFIKNQKTDNDTTNLDRTLFGECAVRHLHALIDPYDSENRFSTI